MWKSTIASVAAASALCGCSGIVKMTPVSPTEISTGYQNKADVDGIIVYRAIPLIEVDRFTQVSVPANSAQPGSAMVLSSACNKVITRKLVTVADWEHPYRLHYEHGILETYTFGATLTADGVLTNINSQSTPDQGKTFSNLASAASSAAGIPKGLPATSLDCTVTPVFVGYEHPPVGGEIKGFGATP
jgi:hypothetical protein